MSLNFAYINPCLLYFQGRQGLRSNQAFCYFCNWNIVLIHVIDYGSRQKVPLLDIHLLSSDVFAPSSYKA